MKWLSRAWPLLLACSLGWGQDIVSQRAGLVVRTAACVGHHADHVGGTIFNKTEETIYGTYEVSVYDDSQALFVRKTEAFTAYPRQSKKFNLKLSPDRCDGPRGYVLRLVATE